MWPSVLRPWRTGLPSVVASGAASTGSLNAPTNLVAYSPGGDTVAVSWEAATFGNGQPAAGYYVTRVKDSDGTGEAACGTSGASPTTSLTCNDLAVADGIYHYTVTAQHGSWTATSLASVSVSVNSEQPTVTVTSISPTPNSNGYNNTTSVVVNLSASDASGIASITYRIDAGTPVTVAGATAAVSVSDDGTHTVTFSARDNMGLDSTDQYQTVLIDTVLPAAPPAPTLTAASDTGFSDTDNISNDSTPTFTGTAEAGSTVTLYSSGTAVGTAVASDGTYTVTASPLAAGTRTMTVRATDLADNLGPSSGSTSITLDYTAPSTPAAPNLSAASDSGRSSTDNITFETTPTYTMAFPAGAVSGTLLAGGVEVGSSTTTTVTSSVLANGVHAMTVRVADAAGNISSASATQTVTIDTTAPAAPTTPVLTAASDTGSSSSDRITNDTTPTFTGSNESLAIVTLWENGLQLGTTTTTGTTYSVTSDAGSDGDQTVTTRATDVAGNLGPASGSTTVTIDTVPPTAPSAPVLDRRQRQRVLLDRRDHQRHHADRHRHRTPGSNVTCTTAAPRSGARRRARRHLDDHEQHPDQREQVPHREDRCRRRRQRRHLRHQHRHDRHRRAIRSGRAEPELDQRQRPLDHRQQHQQHHSDVHQQHAHRCGQHHVVRQWCRGGEQHQLHGHRRRVGGRGVRDVRPGRGRRRKSLGSELHP